MRKVLSFVLVLSLVLGSFGMAFAAPLSDIAGEDFEDAVNVLTELGVVKGYPDGTYKPDNIVTRAEMAVIVVSALGLADYATGTAKFSDMAGHWSNPYVAYATSLGVIAGYPDGTFKPDKTVSYDEAATMLVAALGYTADSLVGTWPANFVTKAKTLGILDGIKAGVAGANRGDIAIMTYQTLDQSIGKTDKDGIWNPTIVQTTPAIVYDVMLDRLDASLFDNGGTITAGDPFVLTDTLADDAVADVRDLVGAYVTAYQNSDGDILAIKEVKSTFLTGEFDSIAGGLIGNDFETDDNDYDVIGTGSPAALYVTTGGDYFTNGEYDAAFAVGATKEYKIAADVSGIKIKDIYSISEWDVDDDFMFEDGDLDDDSIASNVFKLDDNDDIDMSSFELLGVDSLEDIDEDNVVYVYLGATSGKITKIEVGTETASGEVTRIKGGTDFTIGGAVYNFSGELGAITSRPGIDDEIDMILDYAGDIYDYEEISGESDLYGIVLRTGVASESINSLGASDAELELFLADGTKKTFVVDYDETDGGTGTGIPAAVYTTVPSPDTWLLGAGDVIEYALNKDGEIKSIEWVVDASTMTAKRTADTTGPTTAANDLTSKGYFINAAVATDALIMTYDLVAGAFTTDEDNYSVVQRSALLGSEIAAGAFYVVDSGKIIFMYIDDDATSPDTIFALVTDAEENNSDNGYGIEMLIDGASVYKDSDFDATAFAKANFNLLYEVIYNADGTVKNIVAQALDPTTLGTSIFNSARADVTVASDPASRISVSGSVVTIPDVAIPWAADGQFDIINTAGTASTLGSITLDDEVVVYKWNDTDEVYELAKVSDLKGKAEVAFFDTLDDSAMIFNIVLIMDDMTGGFVY